ncbi:MAG TPA: retroviral-like aspartic protease family protein [Vicinamibacterales bacterium]|nr:retroviral-like aspartic protease family protein [Vicinamibacterales bacterium]
MRISTAITTVLLMALPAAAADRSRVTAFELLDDGSIVVPVTIGGTGPYRFVLDTGSSRTVMSTRLWKALRRPVIAKTLVLTPAGRDEAFVVRLDDLSVDGRPPVGVTAAVMPADRYAAGRQVDGLIGQDVLASAVYTIDYDRRSVVWHDAGDVVPGYRLPLSVCNNRLLVSLPQHDGDREPLAFVPDTGSDGLVLFAHAQRKVRSTHIDVGVLTGLTGSRLVNRVQLEDFVVGDTRLRNPLAVVIDHGAAPETMGDGLLPLHLFARVTFNVAEKYLIIHAR